MTTDREWQPIETAPHDGTRVLVFAEGKMTCAYFDLPCAFAGTWELSVPSDGYVDSNEVFPTHWMPLPDAPK